MTVRGTAALVSLLALVACEKASKISTGSLSGKAVYSGKADSSGIAVTAGGYSATTAADGSYSFAALPVGTYEIVAIAPASAERTIAVSATVNSGSNQAPQISFTPSLALAGQLTLMGAAVPGATVTLDTTGATTTTDANGIYSFANATPGVHSLQFTSGSNSDGIPTVLYSPDTGASVPAPYSYQQLFRLQPFDLQVAKRVASVNVKNPSRSIYFQPTLSPDGKLYFYGLSNDQSSANVYVGSTSGGAPVLVTDNAYQSYAPKFSPNSDYIAFVRNNTTVTPTRYELYAVKINAGASPGAPKLLSSSSAGMDPANWDFSPQGGDTPSVYFIEQGSLREVTAEGGPLNLWNGVGTFWLSKLQRTIVFKQAAGTTNRVVAANADGSSNSALQSYDSSATAFSTTFLGFSPDESKFAYWTSAAPPVAQGLKVGGTLTHTVTFVSPDASVSCLNFNADASRIAWDRGGAGGLLTANLPATGGTLTVAQYTATGSRPSSYYAVGLTAPCPTFTDDGRVWLAYQDGAPLFYRLALANADATGTLTPFYTDPGQYPPINYPNYPELFFVTFSRKAAAYGRVNYNDTYSSTLWSKGLAGNASDAPTKVDTGYYYYLRYTTIPKTASTAIYYKYEPATGYTMNGYWTDLANPAATPTRIAVNCSTGNVPLSADESKGLMTYSTQGSGQVAATVDMATGAKKPLMGQASFSAFQQVGTPAATKVIGFRQNTPGPYEFQDGVYIADP